MDAPIHQMADSQRLGTWGEEQVAAHLTRQGLTVGDVRDSPFMRAMDIDFLVQDGPHVVSLDVKSDQRAANLYIEELSTRYADGTGRPGWAYTSQADWIAYYFVKVGTVYWVPLGALREWMARRLTDFEAKYPQNWHGYGNKQHVASSQGRPVPRAVIAREVAGVRVETGLPKLEG